MSKTKTVLGRTLEEIKEECAKDFGFKNYGDVEDWDSEGMIIDEVAKRFAQSQTQELQEQNAELLGLLKKCKELMENSIFTPHKNTASVITQLLTKYNHLNKKP